MSGCIDDSGEVTPKGRHISQHITDNIRQNRAGHNVSWEYIDNPFRKVAQPDGRIIYVYRQQSRARFYSVVVIENDDCAVTAIKDLRPNDLTAMAHHNGWRDLGI